MPAITTTEYIDYVLGAMEFFAQNVIREITGPDSEINTRYITSEGRDEESWLAYLRKEDGTVDTWMVTLRNLKLSADERNSIGSFDKTIHLVADYWTDYKYGVDYNDSANTTNTEREFLKKVLAFDLAMEKKRGCLDSVSYPQVLIEDHNFTAGLKRFKDASCHFLRGDVTLVFYGISLR